MTLTSPSPATLQALDKMEYAMVDAIAPPDVRIVGPHFIVSSYSWPREEQMQGLRGRCICEHNRRNFGTNARTAGAPPSASTAE